MCVNESLFKISMVDLQVTLMIFFMKYIENAPKLHTGYKIYIFILFSLLLLNFHIVKLCIMLLRILNLIFSFLPVFNYCKVCQLECQQFLTNT